MGFSNLQPRGPSTFDDHNFLLDLALMMNKDFWKGHPNELNNSTTKQGSTSRKPTEIPAPHLQAFAISEYNYIKASPLTGQQQITPRMGMGVPVPNLL